MPRTATAVRPMPSPAKEKIMKKSLKATLLSASILALGASIAFADDNDAFTLQSGQDNTALILQSGVGSNVAGSSDHAITQDGDDNTLRIEQIADDIRGGRQNFVGAGSVDAVDNDYAGFLQQGDDNTATIRQDGDRNRVFQLKQIGNDNGATVSQTGSFNGVTSISQSSDGNSVSVTQTGSQNLVGRSQYRALPRSSQNETESGIYQNGGNNTLTISTVGDRNRTYVAAQNSTGFAAGNQASLEILGSDNGQTGFGTGFAAGLGMDSRFVVAGLERSVVRQTGSNGLDVTINGNDNAYGFIQTGTAGLTASVRGSDNQLAVGQNIGIGQALRDDAIVTITGSGNDVGLNQTTNSGASARVSADIDIDGSNNRLGITQTQNGNATSSLVVSLVGSGNNATSLGGFTGDAGSIFFNRTPGYLEQGGSNNTMELKVGAVGSPSDNNLFSMRQSSSNNTINGTIMGSNNQAVVSQSGGDMATFTQNGSFNNIGVRQ
ncbi:hypothetical protein SI859A1_02151 [Aurantimonas manganoxydans SI85-9A1]|uniref:Curlin associated repeat-containing protein n=2 Tax=Aurantimonas manganoxydans TaxID=651183 RepID=Q1YMP5_AURMS|nr:hypothetical protein SI859A1_02151 [Aurantimonas manganoxydans SI85-9A1]